jgi:phosphatidylinositol-3-phosphatase
MKFVSLNSVALPIFLFALAMLLVGCGAVNRSVPLSGNASNPVQSLPSAPVSSDPVPAPTAPPNPSEAIVPASKHVVLVIEENHSYSEVHDGGMPWLVQQGWDYAFAANYHADAVGSALDYFWLSSGSAELQFDCAGWGCKEPITSDNIFRELNRAELSWKVYAESLPKIGWMGGNSGSYAVRHNPAAWYSDIIDSAAQQQKMVPFTEFAGDLTHNRLPNYSLIIPNLKHDAHDGSLFAADQWLEHSVGPLLDQPYFRSGGDGLLIVTFDECDAAEGKCPEQIYTAIIGPKVKPNYKSEHSYRHENTLRTLLDALGIHVYPGASRNAEPMLDFFH